MYLIKNENQEKCRTCLSTENIENDLETRLIINYNHILLSEMLKICTSIQVSWVCLRGRFHLVQFNKIVRAFTSENETPEVSNSERYEQVG